MLPVPAQLIEKNARQQGAGVEDRFPRSCLGVADHEAELITQHAPSLAFPKQLASTFSYN
jgi:hypothetical protein